MQAPQESGGDVEPVGHADLVPDIELRRPQDVGTAALGRDAGNVVRGGIEGQSESRVRHLAAGHVERSDAAEGRGDDNVPFAIDAADQGV